MGLLDKWKKRGKEKQLKAVEKSAEPVELKKEQSAKKTPKKNIKPKKSKKTVKAVKKDAQGSAYRVLVRPVVSEKAAGAEASGVYTFVVDKDAGKTQISRAVEQVYGVAPQKVRIVNMQGKTVRFGRQVGRRSDWKKAMVTLPRGQSINIHEGV